MFRKPWFWIAFVVVTVLCVVYSVAYFSKAFPLVTVDLRMDREAALESARELAEANGWGPEGYRQAASFGVDYQVQSFVELEGGGREAFGRMLTEGLFYPYTWRVRNFKEYETTETLVGFTPAGEPYGFVEKLPEDQPGAALDSEDAQQIAETAATASWGVDLSPFDLVETSQEVRPSDRVDHTFVYERPSPTVGEEGRYRLRLVVSGDRFTELSHFVRVPESFQRRYEEMRSANNGIAAGATIGSAILFLFVGCGVGLFLLLRERWVLWKQPVKWAVFIGFFIGLVVVNQLPLAWMNYDTAVSATHFTLQQLLNAAIAFLGMGLVMAVSFMAAESLSRRAFPHHVQLWKIWSPKVASSPTVAGFTLTGFFLVAFFFAYEVFLYFWANRALGWWTPASNLVQPDVIATYFPWLTSVAISLQAGFWEESLWRAIPIAGAALLGKRYGGRTYWIAAALILQAVLFGAAHANYPAQPAYARLVEIIIPALAFGAIYLAFGLLPAIILHFAVDVAFISMTLFAASSPGIWFDRGLVIVLTLIPLWVVLRGRWKSGAWHEVEEEDRNAAWTPPEAPPVEPAPVAAPAAAGLDRRVRAALLVLGVVGLVIWLVAADFRSDSPPLKTGRGQALEVARQELEDRGVEIPPAWRELSTVEADAGQDHSFVWREGGKDAYGDLLGTYLHPPRWLVRYASWESDVDVAERAEEYRVWIGSDGEALRFRHQLPEKRAGAELEEHQARAMALSAVEASFGLDPGAVEEVSAEPEKLPERKNWKFVFSDPSGYPLSEGDARVAVHIGGDEVVDAYRFVHVPEEWERNERDQRLTIGIVRTVCTVVLVLLYIGGAIAAVVRWSRGRFAVRSFLFFGLLLLALSVVDTLNSWPLIASRFSTAQPFPLQTWVTLAATLFLALVVAGGVALIIGLVHGWLPAQADRSRAVSLGTGVALGALLAGVAAAAAAAAPSLAPSWATYMTGASSIPILGAALAPVVGWILSTALLLLVLGAVHAATQGWTRRRVLFSILLIVLGFALAGAEGADSVGLWLGAGLVTGLLLFAAWVLVLRFHLALIPVAAAAIGILGILRESVIGAYPGALAGGVVAVILIAALAVHWFGRLTKDTAAGGAGPAGAEAAPMEG
jgi:membrane protease YdiL (CAAX protease family)